MKKLILAAYLLACSAIVQAGSLHGDPECLNWYGLDNSVKHAWLNATLAPLNMGHRTRTKSAENKFAELESMQPVAEWMDGYCEQHPREMAITGAMLFFAELTGH